MNRLLSMFGFARRAGKLMTGFDSIKAAVLDGEVRRVYTASDLSPKTLANVRWFCNQANAEQIDCPFTMQEAGLVIGKVTGILAVTDRNMDSKIYSLTGKSPSKD